MSSHVFPAGEHRRRRPMTPRHTRLAQEGIGPRARAFKDRAGRLCTKAKGPYRTVPPHPYRTAPDLCAFAQAQAQAQAQPHGHTATLSHTGTRACRSAHTVTTWNRRPQHQTLAPSRRRRQPQRSADSLSAGPLADGSTLPCGPALALGPVAYGLWPAGCGQSIPPPSNAQHPSTHYYSSLLNEAPSNLHYLAKYHPFHLHYHSKCHPPHIHSFLCHPSMIQP